MFDFIKTSLGTKITLFISMFLVVMVLLGAGFIYMVQAARIDEQFISKVKNLSGIGAQAIGRVIENAIEKGVFSEESAFDNQYEQIPGFVPPKYTTQYDSYMDKEILRFQDEFLKDPAILYAVAIDANGYVPTHNSRFQRDYTGDNQKDYYGNRTKRIFNDPVTVKAIQNQQEVFIQHYQFDSRIDAWDFSSPVFVNGKHWGCFSVGYQAQEPGNVKLSLFRLLFVGSILFLGISICSVYFIVKQSLQPLVAFTQTATHLADGDMERKIRSGRKDEIGQIADALERLRVSMKAAMDRLVRKPDRSHASPPQNKIESLFK